MNYDSCMARSFGTRLQLCKIGEPFLASCLMSTLLRNHLDNIIQLPQNFFKIRYLINVCSDIKKQENAKNADWNYDVFSQISHARF